MGRTWGSNRGSTAVWFPELPSNLRENSTQSTRIWKQNVRSVHGSLLMAAGERDGKPQKSRHKAGNAQRGTELQE